MSDFDEAMAKSRKTLAEGEKAIAESQKFLSELQQQRQFKSAANPNGVRAKRKPGRHPEDPAIVKRILELDSLGKGPKEISRLLAEQSVEKSPGAISKILARTKLTK